MPLLVATSEGDEEAGPGVVLSREEPEGALTGAIDEGVFGQVPDQVKRLAGVPRRSSCRACESGSQDAGRRLEEQGTGPAATRRAEGNVLPAWQTSCYREIIRDQKTLKDRISRQLARR